jgi:hypothetical protein
VSSLPLTSTSPDSSNATVLTQLGWGMRREQRCVTADRLDGEAQLGMKMRGALGAVRGGGRCLRAHPPVVALQPALEREARREVIARGDAARESPVAARARRLALLQGREDAAPGRREATHGPLSAGEGEERPRDERPRRNKQPCQSAGRINWVSCFQPPASSRLPPSRLPPLPLTRRLPCQRRRRPASCHCPAAPQPGRSPAATGPLCRRPRRLRLAASRSSRHLPRQPCPPAPRAARPQAPS